jgi:hypothetical protein
MAEELTAVYIQSESSSLHTPTLASKVSRRYVQYIPIEHADNKDLLAIEIQLAVEECPLTNTPIASG